MQPQNHNLTTPAQKLSKRLSILTIVLGVILLIFMITVEGELGALPLALTIGGIIWFIINQYGIRKGQRRSL